MHPQDGWTNERDWEGDMVVVAVIVGNEDDRKGEQRVATEFYPVICVVHDPFTVIPSENAFLLSSAHNEPNIPL